MRAFSTIMAAAALAQTSMAHYCFNKLIVNGNYTGEYEYVRKNNNSNSPVTDITSTDLRCNSGALMTGNVTSTYKLAAGSQVGFGLDTPIGHPGPLQVYMSKSDGDASEYDGSGEWFKVYEMGVGSITSQGLQWASNEIQNFTFTLPEETPAGQYFLRVEHIALHGASTFEGAQFYISCAQIEVTSDSTATPSPDVSIPGVYTGKEPGLLINIYYPVPTNYTMPGPAVWPNNGTASSNTTTVISSMASSAVATPSAIATTSSALVTSNVAVASSGFTSPANYNSTPPTGFSTILSSALSTGTATSGGTGLTASGQVKKYFQCGGTNYSGATECETGSTCTMWSEFYSQCT